MWYVHSVCGHSMFVPCGVVCACGVVYMVLVFSSRACVCSSSTSVVCAYVRYKAE